MQQVARQVDDIIGLLCICSSAEYMRFMADLKICTGRDMRPTMYCDDFKFSTICNHSVHVLCPMQGAITSTCEVFIALSPICCCTLHPSLHRHASTWQASSGNSMWLSSDDNLTVWYIGRLPAIWSK